MAESHEQGGGDGSTAQQAKEQAREKAGEVQEKARQQAQQAKGQARVKLREQVDTRSTQAGERIGGAAADARSVADELRRQGKETPAKYAEQAAERADRFGGYLRDSDGDALLRDVEDFARRNPWAVAAGGLALGFVASRLLKASSSERYRASTRSTAGADTGLLRGDAEPRTSELAYGSSASGTPSPAVPPEPTVSRRT